ncbi:MAG: hypothetical protein D6698_14105, partial [Gammaproteobacteria bacterium]
EFAFGDLLTGSSPDVHIRPVYPHMRQGSSIISGIAGLFSYVTKDAAYNGHYGLASTSNPIKISDLTLAKHRMPYQLAKMLTPDMIPSGGISGHRVSRMKIHIKNSTDPQDISILRDSKWINQLIIEAVKQFINNRYQALDDEEMLALTIMRTTWMAQTAFPFINKDLLIRYVGKKIRAYIGGRSWRKPQTLRERIIAAMRSSDCHVRKELRKSKLQNMDFTHDDVLKIALKSCQIIIRDVARSKAIYILNRLKKRISHDKQLLREIQKVINNGSYEEFVNSLFPEIKKVASMNEYRKAFRNHAKKNQVPEDKDELEIIIRAETGMSEKELIETIQDKAAHEVERQFQNIMKRLDRLKR